MKIDVKVAQGDDGIWYVVDARGQRYEQCGSWSTKELAEAEAARFLASISG